MSKKRVVLVTTAFPYGTGENFIEPELEALPNDIDLIIVPSQPGNGVLSRTLPEGVKVNTACAVSSNRMVRLKYTLKALFSKSFFVECKKHFPKSLSALKMSLGYLGRAIEISDNLEYCYKQDIEAGAITFYSYWLLEGAHAIGRLKAKYGDSITAVSRAHRVDVYDGESVYGTVPGREYALAHLDKVYVCSKEGSSYLAEKYSKFRDKLVCGYLGTQDFSYSEYGNNGEYFVIVSCARLVELKRVHLLVQALAMITDAKIHWIHMGDGPERNHVEKAVEELPANVTATLMGSTQHADVMNFYQENRVNLFVNTSTTEGLPVSIMEAISFGIPVIATDVGGTSEVVTEETGVLIPADFDVKELAEQIRRYISMNEHEYDDARHRARMFWEENFSASKNYAEFYCEITER